MADVMPNYQVEQQRLRAQIAEQRARIETQKLEILQIEDRKQRHVDNIAASQRAIADYEKNLKSLIEAHGDLSAPKE